MCLSLQSVNDFTWALEKQKVALSSWVGGRLAFAPKSGDIPGEGEADSLC